MDVDEMDELIIKFNSLNPSADRVVKIKPRSGETHGKYANKIYNDKPRSGENYAHHSLKHMLNRAAVNPINFIKSMKVY
jgi:hypothetical protein